MNFEVKKSCYLHLFAENRFQETLTEVNFLLPTAVTLLNVQFKSPTLVSVLHPGFPFGYRL